MPGFEFRTLGLRNLGLGLGFRGSAVRRVTACPRLSTLHPVSGLCKRNKACVSSTVAYPLCSATLGLGDRLLHVREHVGCKR